LRRIFCLTFLIGCPTKTSDQSVPLKRGQKSSSASLTPSPTTTNRQLRDQDKSHQIQRSFSFRGQLLRTQISIDKTLLAQAVEAYGIPEEQESFPTPLTGAVLLERQAAAQKQGVEIFQKGDEVFIRPDFLLLTQRAMAELGDVHRQLAELGRSLGLKSNRANADFLVSFVRSFELDDPPRYRSSGDGKRHLVAGARTAIETLYLGRGDCDTLTLLAGSLLKLSTIEVIYLLGALDGSPHMFLGASVSPRRGDLVTQVDGQAYVVYELTTRHEGSQVPAKFRDVFKNQTFEVLSF
jgi:Arc/MetJ family transcription regulator